MHNLCPHSCFSFPIKLNLYTEYALNNKAGGTIAPVALPLLFVWKALTELHCYRLRWRIVFPGTINNIGRFFPHIDVKPWHESSEFMFHLYKDL